MNKVYKKIFVFDVDGTICTNTNGKYEEAKPFLDMRDRVNRLYDLGHKIIFMTARGSVTKVDYTAKTQEQLKEWGFKYHELVMNQKPHADLFIDDKAVKAEEWRTAGKRIGFVASTFDLMHPGYILLLKEARSVCEHLVCALQSDPAIDRPEKNKPVQTLQERLCVLEAIRYVDEVVVYETEVELRNLLRKMRPDVRILGTDYLNKSFTGSDLNIEIYWHKRDHAWSTTSLRERIAAAENAKVISGTQTEE